MVFSLTGVVCWPCLSGLTYRSDSKRYFQIRESPDNRNRSFLFLSRHVTVALCNMYLGRSLPFGTTKHSRRATLLFWPLKVFSSQSMDVWFQSSGMTKAIGTVSVIPRCSILSNSSTHLLVIQIAIFNISIGPSLYSPSQEWIYQSCPVGSLLILDKTCPTGSLMPYTSVPSWCLKFAPQSGGSHLEIEDGSHIYIYEYLLWTWLGK